MISLDRLDRELVHALQVDGRAPFSKIADVLGTSAPTVARRYARLRSAGHVRVVAVPDSARLGLTEWFVRLRCMPGAAAQVASALARRPDTSWVAVTTDGPEITCLIRTRSRNEADSLLLGKLARTPQVISFTACCLLRQVAGAHGWPGRISALTARQADQLRWRPPGETGSTELDARVLTVLARDGRAGYQDIASAASWSQTTARRRLDQLRSDGTLRFDVDIDPLLLGYASETILSLTIAPARFAAAAAALATHTEIAYAAATTGAANLVAFTVSRDSTALYDYLTTTLARLPGLRHVESASVIRRVKRAAA